MNQNLSADIADAIVTSLSSSEEETRRVAVVSLSSASLEKSSEFLFHAMGDSSWRVRKEAVEVFLSSADAELFIERLFNLLRSQDNAGLRNSAAEALIRLGKSSLPVLELHARDRDSDVRKFVVDILGAIGDRTAVKLLVHSLNDSDPNVAMAAAETLGTIGGAEALQPLLAALSRQDITLRYTILETLAKIGEPFPLETVSPFLAEGLLKKAVYDCLCSVGRADAAPLLVQGLAEAGKSVREAAVKALMAIRDRVPDEWAENACDTLLQGLADTPVVEGLLVLLDTSDIVLHRALIRIFGLIRDPRTARAILRSCRSEQLLPDCLPALRAQGAVSIGFLEDEFSGGDEEERANILRLSGEMGLREAAPLLRRALDEPSPQVREVSVRSVGMIGLIEMIPEVAELLGDFDQDVRIAALETLALLADLDPSSVGKIAAVLAVSDEPDKRRDAVFLCGVLRDRERLSLLMKDADDLVRRTAVQGLARLGGDDVVHHLTMALTDENSGVRIAAASTLGETGKQNAVEPLVLVMADPDPWVRCAALRSLGRIGGDIALAAIESALDETDGLVSLAALDALRHFDTDRSRQLARRATASCNSDVVKSAIELLAELEDPWLDDQWEKFLHHPHWDVRITVVRYLAEKQGQEALPLLRRSLETETDDLVRGRIFEILERY
ncbi:MAG: HEAT repeat domain-containing protein [Geobacteraceae bacterium]|nr:HEAT repeat domain-containing protein [Geobacteraceae bacterium]